MICEPLTGQPINECIELNPQLAGMELADWAEQGSRLEVDILIEADYYWRLVTGVISRQAGGPTTVQTKLGWILSGPISASSSWGSSTNLVFTHAPRADVSVESEPLNSQLRAFWELDSLGIQPNEDTMIESESEITFEGGRYVVALPWKPFHPALPDNYSLSERRLNSLIKRLSQNLKLLHDYDRIIQGQLESRIVEEASVVEPDATRVHYMPHHAVVHGDKVHSSSIWSLL